MKNKIREESASSTIRRRIIELLSQFEMTTLDLARELGQKEKIIQDHLPHVARSVSTGGRKFIIEPPECLACGFVFQDRNRFSRPGRCPKCKKSHISDPKFSIG